MRFITKQPSDSYFQFNNQENWKEVEIFSKKHNLIKGALIGIVITIVIANVVKLLPSYSNYEFEVFKNFILFMTILLTHELIHALCLPKPSEAIYGFIPKKFIFFVTTDKELTSLRLKTALLMPTVLLSIIPLLISMFVKSDLLLNIALLNLIGSGVDILHFTYILKYKKNIKFKFSQSGLYYCNT